MCKRGKIGIGLLAIGALLSACLAWHRPARTPLRGRETSNTAVPPTSNRLEERPVTVRFVPTGAVRSVHVAGTFNGWSSTANALTRQTDGVTWSVTLTLEPGIYAYKFVVDGSRWTLDPDAPHVDDGNGNLNSTLIVSPADYSRAPGRLGDGRITESGVHHDPTRAYVLRPDRGHLRLTLRTRQQDVAQTWLLLGEGKTGKSATAPLPLVRARSDALYDYWVGSVAAPPSGQLRYAFRLQDGAAQRLYDHRGHLMASSAPPQWFELNPADFPPFEIPDWARDAVFYQIFPDRFANGDPSNDPKDVQPWGSPPTPFNRMGGDLEGVAQKLGYLQELGINALYFNPIFTARSNHGYDTTDYHSVDPRLGSTAVLKSLVARAHLRRWHVILDGVFNHTGVDFAGFQSLQKEGASSPYRDWYFVRGFPVQVRDGQTNYAGWYGSPWMPKLNVDNPATRDYLLDISTRWIRETGIDGWRLDAADEVSQDFWRAFRKAVRKADPNAFLVGEIWGNASDWLQGDQFDSVMNYRWRGAVLDFFALDKLSPGKFDARLSRLRETYLPAVTPVLFNMLDSHDTERIKTLCKGDRTREEQAVLFQMTYPGTPCIYYGDEVGMEGGRDPDNRRAMLWDKTQWDTSLLAFYKRLLTLRRDHGVLRRGDYRTILADDKTGVFAFRRDYGKEHVLVVFNRSSQAQKCALPLSQIGTGPFSDWLGNGVKLQKQGGQTLLSLPARGVALLGPIPPAPFPTREGGVGNRYAPLRVNLRR
jgi:cyclomaltodextrinase